MSVEFSPSLLSADFMRLAEAVRSVQAARPEWLHVDVMDGHFVPNLTIGPPVVRALKAVTDTPLDVHLMISNPKEQLDWYLEAGADLVTVHLECGGRPEATAGIRTGDCGQARGSSASVNAVTDPKELYALFERVHAAGRLAGLAINPGTPAELALPFLNSVDLVLVMSVHPGFGGQGFMPLALEKLRLLSAAAAAQGLDLRLEVDGGINEQTATLAVAAGANLLVAGTAVLGAADPAAALERLRAAAGAAAGGTAAEEARAAGAGATSAAGTTPVGAAGTTPVGAAGTTPVGAAAGTGAADAAAAGTTPVGAAAGTGVTAGADAPGGSQRAPLNLA